jgi:hypothetical protein
MNRQLLIGRFSELLGLVPEWGESPVPVCLKDEQTWTSRGSKSRNMISVGEPAEWSLQQNKNDKKKPTKEQKVSSYHSRLGSPAM